MNETQINAVRIAIYEVIRERMQQHATHGEQTRRNGVWREHEDVVQYLLDGCRLEQTGPDGAPWGYLLLEEACEAVLEPDPARLRVELLQVAALAMQWVEALDREAGRHKPKP